jgi:predicted phage terminase large subunit-like protein
MSEVTLERANRWVRETLPSRMTRPDVSVTILIMQRLHQNDPTAETISRLGSENVKHICLPAEKPIFTKGDKKVEIYNSGKIQPEDLAEKYVDGLLDPVRFSRETLEQKKRSLGEFAYASQYEQAPTPRGGNMFKVDRIRIDTPPASMVRKVRYWDKANSHEKGCYTVGVLMGIDKKDRYWILDVVRGQWEAAARENIIKTTAQADGRDVHVALEQEPGGAGKESANSTVKNLAGFVVFKHLPTGSKEVRADTFATQVNAENVLLAEGLWNDEYIKELRFFPNSTYKDQVDASSGAFSIIVGKPRRKGAM